jgi:hypothetical protein
LDRLDATARELAIDLDGTLLAPGHRHIAATRTHRHVSVSWTAEVSNDDRAERTAQTRQALAACDFTTTDGWEKARTLVDNSERTLHRDDLIDHASRVPLPRLDTMLASFLTNPHFSIYDYRAMIEWVATLPTLPWATRRQIHHLAQTAATRFCRELTTVSYNHLDLPALAQLAGTPGDDLLGTALRELGSQPVAPNAHALSSSTSDNPQPSR